MRIKLTSDELKKITHDADKLDEISKRLNYLNQDMDSIAKAIFVINQRLDDLTMIHVKPEKNENK